MSNHGNPGGLSEPGSPLWRNPVIILGTLGVTLVTGGYCALNYVPLTEEERMQDDAVTKIRLILEGMPRRPMQDKVLEQVRKSSPRLGRERPFRTPGLIAFYAGLAVIVAAVVLWLKRSPPEEDPEEEPVTPD